MSSATMAREQTISFYHRVQYLEANDQGVFMKTVFDFPLPSDGQFLLQSLDKFSDNYHLKNIDVAQRYVCLHPGEQPQLASLLEDEWKEDPNVTSVITIFNTQKTRSYTPIALYFNIKEGDKTYNYYLDPQDACRNIQCQLSIVRKDVTGFNQDDVVMLNHQFLRFSNEYYNPGGGGGDNLGDTK